MTRKQIAFRIDEERAKQLEKKRKEEGKTLNTVLERLVDAYLEGKLTDGNSELTGGNNEVEESEITQLANKISQLEKQLTPVNQLLAVTATDKGSFPHTAKNGNGNSKLSLANNEADGNSELKGGNDELTSANSEDDGNDELTDGSSKVTPDNNGADGNSELADGSNELTPDNNEDNGSNELADGNTAPQPHRTDSKDNALTEESNSAIAQKESQIEQLAKDEQLQDLLANNGEHKPIANRIAELLRESGVEKSDFKLKPDDINKIKTPEKRPKSGKLLQAMKLYDEALGIARDRAEM